MNEGNKHHEKFKTKEARQEVYKKFCAHIADGCSVQGFNDPCAYNTVYKMIKTYPNEFDPEELAVAKAKGIHKWEKIGERGILGEINGFNASAWWRTVQNKLGWKDNVQVGGDKDNPLVTAGNSGALSPAEQAVLDHFKRKMLYEIEHQGMHLPNTNKGDSNTK